MIDLTYTKDALFATFYVNSQEGLNAYQTLVEVNGGPTVFLSQLSGTLSQLKQAGYKTRLTRLKRGGESFTGDDAKLLEALGL